MTHRLLVPIALAVLILASSSAVRAASANAASAAHAAASHAELTPQRSAQKGRAQQGKGKKAKGKARGKRPQRRGPIGGQNRIGSLASDYLFRPPINPPAAKKKAEAEAEDPYVLPGVAIATDEQIEEWHLACDYDLNARVSFSEAHMALGFDRARFQLYDKDRDGLMALAEFDKHYRDSLRYGNRFRRPAAAPKRDRAPVRTPEQVRNAYDADLDSKIDLEELTLIILDYRRPDLEPGQVLSGVDIDRDEHLDLIELAGLDEILNPVAILPGDDGGRDLPESIMELFGHEIARGTESVGPPQPPLIVGPLPHFQRLDKDGDGMISVSDLKELMRPLQIPVRITTVLNTLDLDGDGQLSPEELVKAFD